MRLIGKIIGRIIGMTQWYDSVACIWFEACWHDSVFRLREMQLVSRAPLWNGQVDIAHLQANCHCPMDKTHCQAL
jgi:hypothetical protein